MSATLVVLAAGMGSRFGGLKQAQGVTPDGKALVDFSVFDAMRVGFDHFVFVIRKDMENDFKQLVGDRIAAHAKVSYVFQSTDCLPSGRTKPFGTAHAVLCCKDVVSSPFVIVNADDYYGRHAFDDVYNFLQSAKFGQYAMTVYSLRQTISANGTVNRGVCHIKDGYLVDVNECYGLNSDGVGALCGKSVVLPPDTPVSMSLWGLTNDIFDHIQQEFDNFLKNADLSKDELLIQTVISNLIASGKASVKVFKNEDKWLGITYKQDLEQVRADVCTLVECGLYDGIW